MSKRRKSKTARLSAKPKASFRRGLALWGGLILAMWFGFVLVMRLAGRPLPAWARLPDLGVVKEKIADWRRGQEPKPEAGQKQNLSLPLPQATPQEKPAPTRVEPMRPALPTNPPPVIQVNTNTIRVAVEPPFRELVDTSGFPRAARNTFEAQVAMGRLGISSGSIDGAYGSQTRQAVAAFQTRDGLPATGLLDEETYSRMTLREPPLASYTVTQDDLARLAPIPDTWLGKSEARRMDYESILEMVSEMAHAHPDHVRRLNPGVNWETLAPGASVITPKVDPPDYPAKAAFVRIRLGSKTLQAFDSATNLLAHFPCSIAAKVEKRPVGQLVVEKIAENPNYLFDPALFTESEEARQLDRRLVIPPGPNNPVGTAWIGLDRPGYGMHGTPKPEQIGRTESHGCFRLANWNANLLVKMVWVGMPVFVEP